MASAWRLVILGPPGSGKSTQAARLVEAYGLVHLSTGQALRDEIARRTPIGLEAEGHLAQGHLAPTPLVNRLVADCLARLDWRGFILDGYPRTLEQAEALDQMLAERASALDAVLLISIPEETAVERLSSRLVCLNCRATYTEQEAGSVGARCARCGGVLVKRDDDKPAVIRERFAVYHAETAPILAYYRAPGVLVEVDGRGDAVDVYGRVQAALVTIAAKGAS